MRSCCNRRTSICLTDQPDTVCSIGAQLTPPAIGWKTSQWKARQAHTFFRCRYGGWAQAGHPCLLGLPPQARTEIVRASLFHSLFRHRAPPRRALSTIPDAACLRPAGAAPTVLAGSLLRTSAASAATTCAARDAEAKGPAQQCGSLAVLRCLRTSGSLASGDTLACSTMLETPDLRAGRGRDHCVQAHRGGGGGPPLVWGARADCNRLCSE